MKDESKDRKGWRRQKEKAEERLAGLGGELNWSDNAHEVMRWIHPELTLIFYPHRTSAGNYHIRVRKGACKSREVLRLAIHALAENSCHFQFPTEPELHREGVCIAVKTKRGDSISP